MINRTTCPATLIVAWLVNGYIEYVFDISNFVTCGDVEGVEKVGASKNPNVAPQY